MNEERLEKIVIESMSEVTGLNMDSLKKIKSVNLFDKGIINSMSLVSLLTQIENRIDKRIEIRDCKLEDFISIESITDLLVRLN